MNDWIAPLAAIVGAIISGFFSVKAAQASASSNESAEKSKAFAKTVVQLENETWNLLDTWHGRLKSLTREPNIFDSEEIYFEEDYVDTHIFISTSHIAELMNDLLDDYPIAKSTSRIRSLVFEVMRVDETINSRQSPDEVSSGDLEALRRALAELKGQVKLDLEAEKKRLKTL